MNAWKEKIALANLGLQTLENGGDWKKALSSAGLTHEGTGFTPAIESATDAKIALLEFKSAHQHGLLNELGAYND